MAHRNDVYNMHYLDELGFLFKGWAHTCILRGVVAGIVHAAAGGRVYTSVFVVFSRQIEN